MTDANPDYLPRTDDPSLLSHRELVERVEEARTLCRLHADTKLGQSSWILAERILKILEGNQ